MQKNTLITAFLSLALVIAAGFGFAALTSNPASAEGTTTNLNLSQQSTGIWVNGQGKVTVVPDIAVISMGVEANAPTVDQAQQQAAVAMDALMQVLEEAGIEDRDITTQYFNIQPVYEWNENLRTSIITGYRVTNTVTVKIRQIAQSGEVIDQVVAAAGDQTRFNSIYFTVDNPEQYYEEAREKAMQDARSKAEQMANLGGVQLGKPTYINDSSGYNPPVVRWDGVYGQDGSGTAPKTPVSPGETDIVINLQVVYAIQ